MTKKSDKNKVSVVTVKDPKFADIEFFDDCPICQGMKKAKEEGRELSKDELMRLFEEANKKNSN